MVHLAETSLVRLSVSGAKVRENEHLKAKSGNRKQFANRVVSLEFVRLAWRRYLVDGTSFRTTPTLED